MKTALKLMSNLNFPTKLLIIVMAMVLVGLGMALMTIGDLGSDAVTTLIYGVANVLKLSNGQATNLVMMAFLIFGIVFNRKFIGITTLFSVVLMGTFMDIWVSLFSKFIPENLNFPSSVILTVFGSIILGTAIGLYLSMNQGSSPSDTVALWIKTKLKLKYRYASWFFYAICLAIGFILKGRVGFGTGLAFILVSPTADFVLNKLNPEMQK